MLISGMFNKDIIAFRTTGDGPIGGSLYLRDPETFLTTRLKVSSEEMAVCMHSITVFVHPGEGSIAKIADLFDLGRHTIPIISNFWDGTDINPRTLKKVIGEGADTESFRLHLVRNKGIDIAADAELRLNPQLGYNPIEIIFDENNKLWGFHTGGPVAEIFYQAQSQKLEQLKEIMMAAIEGRILPKKQLTPITKPEPQGFFRRLFGARSTSVITAGALVLSSSDNMKKHEIASNSDSGHNQWCQRTAKLPGSKAESCQKI